MNVDFVRDGRHVRVIVHRDDGVKLETTTTRAKNALLPHDLEHFVVENAVGLTSGLWGRVAAGAEFESFAVTTTKPRRRPRTTGRALTRGMSGWDEHIIGVVVGCFEAARATGWSPPDKLPSALPIQKELARVTGSVERDFTRSDVARACIHLHDAIEAWDATPEGGSLSLSWTVKRAFKSRR